MRQPPFDVRVFDCDAHVWEPSAVWDEFLDPARRDAARDAFHCALDAAGTRTVVLNGRPIPPRAASRRRLHALDAATSDPRARLAHMDAVGIERSLLFPTLFAEYLPAVDDPELASLLARAYNDWVEAFAATAPRRLFAAAILPFNAPDLAESEARRVIARGFRACVVRPCFHGERFINHPGYARVWRVLEAAGVAVFIHAAAGGDDADTSASGTIAPIRDAALALTTFCFDGHMEDYPHLRIAYAHAGAWWVPVVLERAETYLCIGALGRDVSLEPARVFFARPTLVQVDGWEPFVQRDPERWAGVGAWGSRHPNHDASTPAEAMANFARQQIPPDIVARLMGGNAAAFLGLEPDAG